MRVIHIAFEVAPIYKTGGLGDVTGSLPIALEKEGIDTAVVMPDYPWIKHLKRLPDSKVRVHYIKSPFFTEKLKTNDRSLQARAFADFAQKTLNYIEQHQITADILHCHDWHAALIPWLMKKLSKSYFKSTKTILTIHNISFQGRFPARYLDHPELQILQALLDKRQQILSYLKLGIETAGFITTVSPNHTREILDGVASFGCTKAINKKRSKFKGILNGIDYSVWNPRVDASIYRTYNPHTVLNGKKFNKLKLQKKLGLEISPDIPLYGFVARLTEQKGLELLIPILDTVPRQRIQIGILGSGQKKYERMLKLCQKNIDARWYSVTVSFDETLAHRIFAGSDFFLVPSLFEPCGLTQMIAMAYGSIPIVSQVGGLADTVEDGKNGLVFAPQTSKVLAEVIERASDIWEDKGVYELMVKSAMSADFSWKKSAREYASLYRKVRKI